MGTCGEKGDSGVFGAEVLFVPAELRFRARELKVPAGDLMLELPESRLTCDCTVVRDGLDVTPLADLSFLEKIPMLAGSAVWHKYGAVWNGPRCTRTGSTFATGGLRKAGRAKGREQVGPFDDDQELEEGSSSRNGPR